MRPNSASIGEEHVQPTITGDSVPDDLLDGCLVGGVKAAGVDVNVGPRGVDLALVRLQVLVVKVTDVDGPGAVLGELVGCCSTETEDRVRALGNWSVSVVNFEFESSIYQL